MINAKKNINIYPAQPRPCFSVTLYLGFHLTHLCSALCFSNPEEVRSLKY